MGLYDKKYKEFFSDPDMFKSFLLDFVKEKWVNDLDFSTMELVNKSLLQKMTKSFMMILSGRLS